VNAWEDVAVGDALDPVTVLITLQRLVMEAGVNRDFSPWHFDPVAAHDSGAQDVFANTTFVETLLEAGIRSWAGLAPRIRMLEFALRAPNCIGDEVSAAGVVTAKHADGGDRTVHVDVWLESHRGRTVEGSAVVAF
jgi:acyl dehydratase